MENAIYTFIVNLVLSRCFPPPWFFFGGVPQRRRCPGRFQDSFQSNFKVPPLKVRYAGGDAVTVVDLLTIIFLAWFPMGVFGPEKVSLAPGHGLFAAPPPMCETRKAVRQTDTLQSRFVANSGNEVYRNTTG